MRVHRDKAGMAKVADQIVEEIAVRPSTLGQLADRFGVSVFTVRRRLTDLAQAKRAHYVEVPTAGGMGLAYVWHAGEGDDDLPDEMSQCVVQEYSAHGQRDPLVAALFGPAKEAA